MRWDGQGVSVDDGALPGLQRIGFVRSVRTPQFEGITFHEVLCKSALNKVPNAAMLPFRYTVNGYRGCSHACRYCFARPTHEYLDLDCGTDFDSQVVVKTNVADVLRRELHRPSWQRETVALGTNTDPYQRAEGRYALMPGIIGALADSGTPFSILTKGTLLRRDLPLITEAARRVDVSVAVSLAVGDPELHKDVEPGTPSPQARLGLISAIRDAGLDCHVMVAPVLPRLTDSVEAPRRAARSDRRGRRDGRDGVRAAPAWLDARLVHGMAGAYTPGAGRAVSRVVPAGRLPTVGLPKDAARQGDTAGRQAWPRPGPPVVPRGRGPSGATGRVCYSRRCSNFCPSRRPSPRVGGNAIGSLLWAHGSVVAY